MAPTGQIIEHVGKDGRTYRSLRVRVYGKRRFLSLGPVSVDQAKRELRGVLADVERGTWRPSEPAPESPPDPGAVTFHEFAALEWWPERQRELAPKTQSDYKWRLEVHLAPFFGRMRLDQIGPGDVDRYKAAKLSVRRPLSPRSINMTLTLLSAILETAHERELIHRNPAAGRRRRVKPVKAQRTYLDTAEQVTALLDAAGALDAAASDGRRHIPRRTLLAVLVFSGLRIGEALELRWRDVDPASGRLRIRGTKTRTAVRDVTIQPALRDELLTWKATTKRSAAGELVFASATGGSFTATNVRRRILAPAAVRASAALESEGCIPLPDRLTPHSLRRTFASILCAIGEPPPVVMAEMGHTDPTMTLGVYAQAMRRGEDERTRLRALVHGSAPADGSEWAFLGSRGDEGDVSEAGRHSVETLEMPR